MAFDLSLLLLLLLGASVSSKPIDFTPEEDVNDVDTGTQGDRKRVVDEVEATEVLEVPRPFARLSNEQMKPNGLRMSVVSSTTGPSNMRDTAKDIDIENLWNQPNETVAANNASTIQQGFEWILAPFSQKIQFSPQAFFQDRLAQLKDTLSRIGSIFPNQQNGGSKQFGNTGLMNLVGLNDSGFYTNRLDPVGFFGGNGWLANKGGILGGPGAFVSTGSLLTDYPSAYKK